MNYQPLPWQQQEWQSIVARVHKKTLAHAFLLKGTPGIGKLHFAKVIAGYLLCEIPKHNLPCEQCKGCCLIKADSHPDLLTIQPEESGRAIKVDQIRTINTFAHQTAQQGGRRIIIVSPAESMNINASNALLKCLEEPGSETLFLLISHRSSDLLPTIRSRCQLMNFAPPAHTVASEWLAEQTEDLHDADILIRLSSGAPLLAKAMLRQGTLEQRSGLIKSVKALIRGELTPTDLAKECQKADIGLILQWLADWLGDIIRFNMTADVSHIRNEDIVDLIQYFSRKTIEIKQVVLVRDWLIIQRQTVLTGGNLNGQLLMEGAFCRLLNIIIQSDIPRRLQIN